jgi:hypothetical protein
MIIQGSTISGINIYGESPLYEFVTWTFTNGNSVGRTGPTVSNLRVLYNTVGNTWINNDAYFTVTGGIQYWTVPRSGTYTIRARGAQGAPATATGGGLGADMQGDFVLQQGQKLQILIGQSGRPPTSAASFGNSSAGGGGSFVVLNSGAVTTVANIDLLLAAGGGGGSGNVLLANSRANASIGITGQAAWAVVGNVAGGAAGMGGSTGTADNGAGAGFWGNGAGSGGTAFRFGGNGGIINSQYSPFGGGFGGGGSVNQGLFGRWSGGGGYSGGGATNSVSGVAPNAPANNQPYFGGGGASYNIGANQINQGNAQGNFGNGSVTITFVSGL